MTDAEKAQQIVRLTTYAKLLNTSIGDTEDDVALLAFSVTEILDRVRLYLNRDDVPVLVEKPLAKPIGNLFHKYNGTKTETDVAQTVSRVSDNGQSVSYSSKVKNYFATVNDDELFTGVENVLKPHRRLNFGTSDQL